jgi:hypothetical protein
VGGGRDEELNWKVQDVERMEGSSWAEDEMGVWWGRRKGSSDGPEEEGGRMGVMLGFSRMVTKSWSKL